MNELNELDEHKDNGFFLAYKIGSSEYTSRFSDQTTDGIISRFALFLLGCGFSRESIIDGFTSKAVELSDDP